MVDGEKAQTIVGSPVLCGGVGWAKQAMESKPVSSTPPSLCFSSCLQVSNMAFLNDLGPSIYKPNKPFTQYSWLVFYHSNLKQTIEEVEYFCDRADHVLKGL